MLLDVLNYSKYQRQFDEEQDIVPNKKINLIDSNEQNSLITKDMV